MLNYYRVYLKKANVKKCKLRPLYTAANAYSVPFVTSQLKVSAFSLSEKLLPYLQLLPYNQVDSIPNIHFITIIINCQYITV